MEMSEFYIDRTMKHSAKINVHHVQHTQLIQVTIT